MREENEMNEANRPNAMAVRRAAILHNVEVLNRAKNIAEVEVDELVDVQAAQDRVMRGEKL